MNGENNTTLERRMSNREKNKKTKTKALRSVRERKKKKTKPLPANVRQEETVILFLLGFTRYRNDVSKMSGTRVAFGFSGISLVSVGFNWSIIRKHVTRTSG